MNNPKIIRIDAGTEVCSNIKNFTINKTQNFIVVNETESHFFVNIKESKFLYSVRKDKIKYVTFKKRTLKFDELKKDEILNIFDNYKKLIKKAQLISKELSKFDFRQHDMTLSNIDKINVLIVGDYMTLTREYTDKKCECIIPLKYLWDHDWKNTLKKEYSKSV